MNGFSKQRRLSRREVLRAAGLASGGLLFGGALAACGDGSSSGGSASAEPGKVVLGVYGGPQQPVYENYVAKAMRESGAEVTLVLATGGARINTIYAEKGQPSMDVAMLAVPDALTAVADGVVEKLDPKVPHADEIEDFAKEGGYMVSGFTLGLGYNPDKIDKPTSFEDLWNPDYKGHIAVPDPGKNANGTTFIAMLTKMYADGNYASNDKVWDKLKELRPNVVLQYSSENDVNELWEQQDIWLAVRSSAFTWQFQKAAPNVKVDFITPKEGAALMGNVATIPVGAPNADLARDAIGHMLDEPFQKEFAEDQFFLPTRKDITLSPDTQAKMPKVDEVQSLPWGEIGKTRAQWVDRWTREMSG
ncbi:extracellular solute-binding protein [Actinophytocola sp.]|uniref:extracellular solute-binding protein n=1 Tax=Actinophytocola sp. TaxID=1872138 RepID=UPI003D6B3EBE